MMKESNMGVQYICTWGFSGDVTVVLAAILSSYDNMLIIMTRSYGFVCLVVFVLYNTYC